MTNRFLPFYTALSGFWGKGWYVTPPNPPKIKNPASRAVFFVLLGILCGAFGAAKADTETVDNGDGTFTVRVYPEPYVPAAVDIVASDTFGDYETTTGPLRARFREDTSVDYTTGEQTIGLKPSDIWFDTTNTTALVVTSSHSLQPVGGKLDVSNLWGKGIAAKYEARENAVKETLTLEQPFLDTIPLGAKTVEFRWTLDNPGGLTVALNGAGLVVGDFVIEPLEAHDAAGAYLPGRCVYRDGEVIGTLDAAWLRTAAAPVLVDPMVETVGESESRGMGNVTAIFRYVYWKTFLEMALPDIGGGTVTDAVLKVTVDDVDDSGTVIYAYVEDPNNPAPAWTSSSNIVTMNTVDDDLIQDGSVTVTSTGQKSWDVTTTIAAMYNASAATATIMLTGSPDAKTDGTQVTSSWYAGDDDTLPGSDYTIEYDILFDKDTDPELEVTYEAGGEGEGEAEQDPAVGGVLRH